jgi:hypothetical protein
LEQDDDIFFYRNLIDAFGLIFKSDNARNNRTNIIQC